MQSERNGGTKGAMLRVTAFWPEARPAAFVEVFLRHGDYAQSYEPFARGRTDEHGVVMFGGVPIGKVRLASARGDNGSTEIAAGENEYRFELAAGVAVRGRVVDPAGSAVGGATIWLQTGGHSWWNGSAVATANGTGTFEVEHIPGEASLAAYAAGYGPSAMIEVESIDTAKPGSQVTLQLTEGGGGLSGRVLDHAGAPIAGATVVAGVAPTRLETRGMKLIPQWTGHHALTDDEGRFAMPCLKTGKQPVSARADGFGIWRGEATILAGATTNVEVRLQAAATIHGRVTDGDGRPVNGASVRAYDLAPRTTFLAGGQIDFDEEFGHVGTICDADGNYRLEGVTPGTAYVFAQEKLDRSSSSAGKTLVWASQELQLAPGSDTVWDPVLDEGRTISGVVLYRDGHPFPGLFVTLTDEKTGTTQTFNTGRSAEFRFCCLGASTYALRVQVWLPEGGAGFVSREGLVPDQGKIEVRAEFDKPVKVEPGVVIGRIDDRGGRIRNPGAATVTLHIGNSSWRDGGKIVDGAFRIEDVKPGRHRVTLVEGNTVLACSDWFEVASAATTDAGALVTEPGGALRITIDRDQNSREFEPTLALRRDGDPGTGSYRISLSRATEYLAENLTPGDYDISCFGKGIKSHKARATVVADVTGTATVEVRRCALARLDVWWPNGHQGTKTWRYRVTGLDGALLIERDDTYRGDIRPYPAVIAATPGTWHVDYTTDDGLHGTTDFTIGPDYADVTGRIDLQKR
jgi:protocatechuate 3,4-dioxygenase beta subunit